MYKYDHIGIILDKPTEGMRYFPEFKCWTTDPEKSEFRIEWIYFEKTSKFHPLIKTVSHVCFVVEDIHDAIKGKKILLEPCLFEGTWMAFIEYEGAPIEFFQYAPN